MCFENELLGSLECLLGLSVEKQWPLEPSQVP